MNSTLHKFLEEMKSVAEDFKSELIRNIPNRNPMHSLLVLKYFNRLIAVNEILLAACEHTGEIEFGNCCH